MRIRGLRSPKPESEFVLGDHFDLNDPYAVHHDPSAITGAMLDAAHFDYEKRDRKTHPNYLSDIHWERDFKRCE